MYMCMITMCMYAQQGYVFGHISLCTCLYNYIW